MPMIPQILIVEDHEHLATALAMNFGGDPRFVVCGAAASLSQAIKMMSEVRADLVLVDLNLPDGSGLDLIPRLRELNPAARYLIFSQEDPAIFSVHARKAGAHGYLRKGASTTSLLNIAADVAAGGEYFTGAKSA